MRLRAVTHLGVVFERPGDRLASAFQLLLVGLAAVRREQRAQEADEREAGHDPAVAEHQLRPECDRDHADGRQGNQHDRNVHEQWVGGQAADFLEHQ